MKRIRNRNENRFNIRAFEKVIVLRVALFDAHLVAHERQQILGGIAYSRKTDVARFHKGRTVGPLSYRSATDKAQPQDAFTQEVSSFIKYNYLSVECFMLSSQHQQRAGSR